jgi:hypothetical protein
MGDNISSGPVDTDSENLLKTLITTTDKIHPRTHSNSANEERINVDEEKVFMKRILNLALCDSASSPDLVVPCPNCEKPTWLPEEKSRVDKGVAKGVAKGSAKGGAKPTRAMCPHCDCVICVLCKV